MLCLCTSGDLHLLPKSAHIEVNASDTSCLDSRFSTGSEVVSFTLLHSAKADPCLALAAGLLKFWISFRFSFLGDSNPINLDNLALCTVRWIFSVRCWWMKEHCSTSSFVNSMTESQALSTLSTLFGENILGGFCNLPSTCTP